MPLRSFKNSLQEYFTFTNREKKPILVLIFLILISMGVLMYLKFKPENTKIDFSSFEKEIVAFEKQLSQDSLFAAAKKIETAHERNFAIKSEPLYEAAVFDFNPNNLPDSLWLKLGISQRTVKTIKNYESKGGKFYKKEDVKKIYGFDEKDFARLESYIIIPAKPSAFKRDSSYEKTEATFNKPVKPIIAFDLNLVSVDELKSLYGIGDAKANSIVKYRSMLGGFFAKEQLLEAYGIDSVLYESIKIYLDVKTNYIRSLNINTAYEPELKHPYISKQLAASLVSYRKMHGNFKCIEDVKKLSLINEEIYRKLAPYLSVN
ncbi:MAG: helix-hairpin-helix domain-containing protein [Bacteroidota bacterium]